MNRLLIGFLLLLCFLTSCREKNPEKGQNAPATATKEQLIALNKARVAEENDQIESLLLRYKWPVTTTETGVHYWIHEEGTGDQIALDDEIVYSYRVRLITGDEVYHSDRDGLLVCKVGKSNVPAGLEEVILLMRPNAAAKMVIPSYLAYGIAGDGDRIPPSSTLIYEIKILEVKQLN